MKNARRLDVRIVLVRPRNPLNIGAAARAMANFGFSDLAVVKPYPPVWRETVSAVGAERLVLEAQAVNSVEEAVADRHVVFGTTTTRRRRLERPLIRLPDLPSTLRRRDGVTRIAFLFGPEKTGLTNRHLRRCHYLLTIPTSDRSPSMNLGQAVAACCYELARTHSDLGPASPMAPLESPPTLRETRRLVRHALEVFGAAGYLTFLSPEERENKVHRTFLGWRLKRRDLALLHGAFRFMLRSLREKA